MISESTGGALTVQASVDHHGGDPSGQTPVYRPLCSRPVPVLPGLPHGRHGPDVVPRPFRRRRGGIGPLPPGASAYDLLTELAATAPAGCDGLTMLPHLAGAFSPEYEPAARGVFAGLTLAHGRAHLVRAVLESVAFMLRRNLELLATAGAPASEIRSHGGGARSALWNQVKADVCGLPVVTLEGEDAAVRGDAMLAGVAVGVFPDLGAAAAALVAPAGAVRAGPGQSRRVRRCLRPLRPSCSTPSDRCSRGPGTAG